MKKVLFLFGVQKEIFKNKKKIIFTNESNFLHLQQKVLKDFSTADIDKYDETVSSKKLKHCIEKAYCQCNWQRISLLIYVEVDIHYIL